MSTILQAEYPHVDEAIHKPGIAASLTPGAIRLSVGEVNSRAEFMLMQDEWNALVRATEDQPFY
ncbi:MAG TPA: hypothetical protein VFH60_08835, partial [Chloroflexia bacterium]|nr:hypothetical protein [Chloroflexia bacterium]